MHSEFLAPLCWIEHHRHLRDGPLEKLWGGGGEISSRRNFFFVSKFFAWICLAWIFFRNWRALILLLLLFYFPLREYFFTSSFPCRSLQDNPELSINSNPTVGALFIIISVSTYFLFTVFCWIFIHKNANKIWVLRYGEPLLSEISPAPFSAGFELFKRVFRLICYG